jgi:peptidoglycan/LPS O-acetylase OafA/YrhL
VALLVAMRYGGRRTALILAACLAVVAMVDAVFIGGMWAAVSRGSGLFVGSALALAGDAFWLRWARAWRVVTPVAAVAALTLLLKGSDQSWPLVVLASALVVGGLARHPMSRLSQILAWGPLVWVGRRSYALYVLNLPLTALLLPSLGFGPILLLSAGTLSLVGAAASWRYIEAPLAARGRERDVRAALHRGAVTTMPLEGA